MGSPTGSTISAITADSSFSTASSNRIKKFSNNSLGPRVHYQICLFGHTTHLPVQCKHVTGNTSDVTGKAIRSQTNCDLLKYLYQSRHKMMYFPTCKANLCIDCYKLFHEEPDLVGKKNQLKQKPGIKDKAYLYFCFCFNSYIYFNQKHSIFTHVLPLRQKKSKISQ